MANQRNIIGALVHDVRCARGIATTLCNEPRKDFASTPTGTGKRETYVGKSLRTGSDSSKFSFRLFRREITRHSIDFDHRSSDITDTTLHGEAFLLTFVKYAEYLIASYSHFSRFKMEMKKV